MMSGIKARFWLLRFLLVLILLFLHVNQELPVFEIDLQGFEIDFSKLSFCFDWKPLDLDDSTWLDEPETNRDFVARTMQTMLENIHIVINLWVCFGIWLLFFLFCFGGREQAWNWERYWGQTSIHLLEPLSTSLSKWMIPLMVIRLNPMEQWFATCPEILKYVLACLNHPLLEFSSRFVISAVSPNLSTESDFRATH